MDISFVPVSFSILTETTTEIEGDINIEMQYSSEPPGGDYVALKKLREEPGTYMFTTDIIYLPISKTIKKIVMPNTT